MNKTLVHVTLLGAVLALAACQSAKVNPTAGGGGLAGNWAPTTGGYTAIFRAGTFQTVATDTSNVISQGNYVVQSEKMVKLNWSSNVTGLANSAQCDRPNPNSLNCTDAGGKTFTLNRIAG